MGGGRTDLVVFGANGPTGRRVVAQALAAGHRVAAVTRRPDEYPLSAPLLDVVLADVVDPDAVGRAVAGAGAVISTYGIPYTRAEVTVYSQGITHIVRAMEVHGVRRLVCVTSTSLATEQAPGDPWFFRRVVHPLLRRVVGRTVYDDMERMEEIVRDSGLDWTVVRPGGLFDADEPTDDYEVAPRRLAGGATSRADLAALLVAEATGSGHVGATVEVMTRTGVPHWSTFAKEAFGR